MSNYITSSSACHRVVAKGSKAMLGQRGQREVFLSICSKPPLDCCLDPKLLKPRLIDGITCNSDIERSLALLVNEKPSKSARWSFICMESSF